MSGLVIVWHSRTGASRMMAAAAHRGAGEDSLLIGAERVTIEHLLAAAGFLFVCPENLGAMSGLMKEMFDQAYYPLLGRIEGRAYATAIAAGSDGSGAVRQIDRIATGWRLRRVAEPLIVTLDAQSSTRIMAEKTVTPRDLARCHELGAAMAEGLRQAIF